MTASSTPRSFFALQRITSELFREGQFAVCLYSRERSSNAFPKKKIGNPVEGEFFMCDSG